MSWPFNYLRCHSQEERNVLPDPENVIVHVDGLLQFLDGSASTTSPPRIVLILHFSKHNVDDLSHFLQPISFLVFSCCLFSIIQLLLSLPITSAYLWRVVALLAEVLYEFNQAVNHQLHSQHYAFQLLPWRCRGVCTQINDTFSVRDLKKVQAVACMKDHPDTIKSGQKLISLPCFLDENTCSYVIISIIQYAS